MKEIKPEQDYYVLFDISPKLSGPEVSDRLKEVGRIWTQRANSSPQIEQRHHAELMVRLLAEAESILLDPAKRSAYDKSLGISRTEDGSSTTPSSTSRRGGPESLPAAACPRCGLRKLETSEFCPACGFQFLDHVDTAKASHRMPKRAAPAAPSPTSGGAGDQRPIPQEIPFLSEIMSYFNGRKLSISGTVIAIDSIYMVKPKPMPLLLKIAIALFLLPFALGILIVVSLFSMMSSGQGGQKGFLSQIGSHMATIFLVDRVFGQKEQVPVRDIRLRDIGGHEHLVRVRGELIAGTVNVGDEIDVEGTDENGTLMLERGWNKRIRTEIKVKRR